MNQSEMNNVLKALEIKEFNTMQKEAFESIQHNTNTILLAPTGSGKTLAFLMPVYMQFLQANAIAKPQAIIIAPTRELALQIQQVWRSMQTGFKSVACYGGHKIDTEINELVEKPALIIGTPGRLNDHLTRQTIDVSSLNTCIIDEFDKTLELGFLNELEDIITALPHINKKVLVSATPLLDIPAFLQFHEPIIINKIEEHRPTQIEVFCITSPEKDKLDTLEKLLTCELQGSTIIFINHREAAQRIHDHFAINKINSVVYHGGMEQLDREISIIKFKNHTADILIASDIASRGLDIDAVANIIHYHLPDTQEAYTHRNGRTARQTSTGCIYIIKHEDEILPDYIEQDCKNFYIKNMPDMKWESEWLTLTVNAGKKNKVNKIDIVGFLSKVAHLHKEEIGMISVLDKISFVAVPKNIYKEILDNVRNQKIKGKDFIFRVAK
jgi:ATP-dependent RNA helicase DeaD